MIQSEPCPSKIFDVPDFSSSGADTEGQLAVLSRTLVERSQLCYKETAATLPPRALLAAMLLSPLCPLLLLLLHTFATKS